MCKKAFLFSLILVFGLTGCGKEENDVVSSVDFEPKQPTSVSPAVNGDVVTPPVQEMKTPPATTKQESVTPAVQEAVATQEESEGSVNQEIPVSETTQKDAVSEEGIDQPNQQTEAEKGANVQEQFPPVISQEVFPASPTSQFPQQEAGKQKVTEAIIKQESFVEQQMQAGEGEQVPMESIVSNVEEVKDVVTEQPSIEAEKMVVPGETSFSTPAPDVGGDVD